MYSIPNGPVVGAGKPPPPNSSKIPKKERGKSVKVADNALRPNSRKGLKSGLKMKREASHADRRVGSNQWNMNTNSASDGFGSGGNFPQKISREEQ